MQFEAEIKQQFNDTKDDMDLAIDHLQTELKKIRTGKASPDMVSGIMADYYGNMTPLNQVANVSTSDAKTLVIQPWEKKMLSVIEKAIFEANLGFTPQNDGEVIRINVPPLTEERRHQLVKMSKSLGEEAKVSLRNTRHKALDFVRKAVKNSYPEDLGKRRENEIQDLVNKYSDKIEEILKLKEKEILTV